MFDLKTASLEIRKCARAQHVHSGQFEPVNAGSTVDSLPDEAIVARVYNRNHPDGIEVTAGDVRYAGLYL